MYLHYYPKYSYKYYKVSPIYETESNSLSKPINFIFLNPDVLMAQFLWTFKTGIVTKHQSTKVWKKHLNVKQKKSDFAVLV